MRQRVAAVIIALLLGGALVMLLIASRDRPLIVAKTPAMEETPQVPAEPPVPAATDSSAASAAPDAAPELPGPVPVKPARPALAAAATPPSGPETLLPPLTVLENMRTVFRQYSSRYGGNPVGDNAEITAALNGRNPRQIVFLNSDDGLRSNDRGELIDNWGTPFFFHQISGTQMEIHSAGPDRRMWTADDLVIK